MFNSKLKIYFVGGTKRAVNLYQKILEREDIEIVYSIFMKGYDDEHIYCEELVQLANKNNLQFIVSDKITDKIIFKINQDKPDVAIGGGIWRNIISKNFYSVPKYGYIGLHGSGLPKYRGWAGINWYIINGEKSYNLRMYQLADGIDDGPLVADKYGRLLEYKIPLENEKHIDQVLEELYPLHIKAYMDLFDLLVNGNIDFIPQNEAEATYTCNRNPEDGEINWNNSTKDIFNFIRAQSRPYQGAYTFFNGEKITFWRVKPRYDYSNYIGRIAGKVVTRNKDSNSVVILTNDGGIEVFEAENESGETDLLKIFNSVRKKCKSEVEAFIENFKDGKIEYKYFKDNKNAE